MFFTLRAPKPVDYESIASWVPDAVAWLRWAGPRVPFSFTADLPTLLSVVDGESYCLADKSAIPLGFGQYWVLTPGSVHLGRIIVSPLARGKGIGRMLCQQLVAKAIQTTGATTVTLRVYRDNAAAVALYTSLGFAPVECESDTEVHFMKAETLCSSLPNKLS